MVVELNGFLTGVGAGEYVHSVLLELQHSNEEFHTLEKEFSTGKVICMTDARSQQSTLNKDAGQPTHKRVRILIAHVKELLGENNYDDDDDDPAFAEWVDTSHMLADVLTKTGCECEPILTALHDGIWQ